MAFTLKLDDGICKAFKNEADVDLFVNKGYDEDSKTHFLLVLIPKDETLGIVQVLNPIPYANEEERDNAFKNNINDYFANQFYEALTKQVNENKLNKNKTDNNEVL